MSEINPGNEKIKRRYLRHLQEARGLAPATIDHALRAVTHYEVFTERKDLGRFRSDDAIRYRKHLVKSTATIKAGSEAVHGLLQPQARPAILSLASRSGRLSQPSAHH